MGAPREDLDRLLENARWARALGIELVGRGEADDLVQDAWVVALEKPGGVLNPAAWLSGVLRHLARHRHRGEERRARRERAGARGEAQPGADELVLEAELQRELIRAVTELDEPYRTTVLLRFYRGWTPDEIARSQRVPGATVRTRLHRALARLRERLDREHGGREAWALAFATPGAATLTTGTTAGTITGGTLLGAKTTIAVAAAVAALAGYAWWGNGDGEHGSARDEQGVAVAAAAPAGASEAPPESAPVDGERARREPLESAANAGPAVAEVLLYGSALDGQGKPVELESLSVADEQGTWHSSSGSASGSYSIAGLAPGRYALRARAAGFVTRREELELRADEAHQRHDLVLAAVRSLPVKIVDASGALIPEESQTLPLEVVVTRTAPGDGLSGLDGRAYELAELGELVSGTYQRIPELPGGYSGLLRLRAPLPLFASLIALDATLETKAIDEDTRELVFTLEPARLAGRLGAVRARFVDALGGAPLSEGRAHLQAGEVDLAATLDAHGEARFEGCAPGFYCLCFAVQEHEPFARRVRVEPGKELDLGDIPLGPRGVLRGVVRDAEGKALNASLRWTSLSALRTPVDVEAGEERGVRGEFELGVACAPLQLVAEAPGHALLVRTLDASGGLVEGLELRLEEGVPVVLDTSRLALGMELTLADEGGVPFARLAPFEGRATTRLAPGRYQLWRGAGGRVEASEELVVGNEPLRWTVGGR